MLPAPWAKKRTIKLKFNTCNIQPRQSHEHNQIGLLWDTVCQNHTWHIGTWPCLSQPTMTNHLTFCMTYTVAVCPAVGRKEQVINNNYDEIHEISIFCLLAILQKRHVKHCENMWSEETGHDMHCKQQRHFNPPVRSGECIVYTVYQQGPPN